MPKKLKYCTMKVAQNGKNNVHNNTLQKKLLDVTKNKKLIFLFPLPTAACWNRISKRNIGSINTQSCGG